MPAALAATSVPDTPVSTKVIGLPQVPAAPSGREFDHRLGGAPVPWTHTAVTTPAPTATCGL